jgi:hypothetical protein
MQCRFTTGGVARRALPKIGAVKTKENALCAGPSTLARMLRVARSSLPKSPVIAEHVPLHPLTAADSARWPDGLVVRRIPDLNPGQEWPGDVLDTWRFHAFFTTSDHEMVDTVAGDRTHRGHAIIEQVHGDLKHSALAHQPSGMFERGLAGVGRDGTKRDPRSRDRGGHRTGQVDECDGPPQIHLPARTGCVLRPTSHPAPPTAWPCKTAITDLFARVCGPRPAPTT